MDDLFSQYSFFERTVPENIIYNIRKISEFNNDVLYPNEQEYIAKCCEKRQREFVAGRILAKRILSFLGVNNFPVLSGEFREPLWPNDIVGSISHCDNYCFVAAAKNRNFYSIGVDIETSNPLAENLEDIVCTNSEQNWIKLTKSKGCLLPLSKIIFSSKESIYKCIYPILKRYVDFKEVEILLQISAPYFRAYILPTSKADISFREKISIIGLFSIEKGCICSLASWAV